MERKFMACQVCWKIEWIINDLIVWFSNWMPNCFSCRKFFLHQNKNFFLLHRDRKINEKNIKKLEGGWKLFDAENANVYNMWYRAREWGLAGSLFEKYSWTRFRVVEAPWSGFPLVKVEMGVGLSTLAKSKRKREDTERKLVGEGATRTPKLSPSREILWSTRRQFLSLDLNARWSSMNMEDSWSLLRSLVVSIEAARELPVPTTSNCRLLSNSIAFKSGKHIERAQTKVYRVTPPFRRIFLTLSQIFFMQSLRLTVCMHTHSIF